MQSPFGILTGYGYASALASVGIGHHLSEPAARVLYTFWYRIRRAEVTHIPGPVPGAGTSAVVLLRSHMGGGCEDIVCSAGVDSVLVSIGHGSDVTSRQDEVFAVSVELSHPDGARLQGRIQLVADIVSMAVLGDEFLGDSGSIRADAIVVIERIDFEIAH